jgi:hypothetical protein
MKVGGIAVEYIKVNFTENTINPACFAVLPEMPVAVYAGFSFVNIMRYP